MFTSCIRPSSPDLRCKVPIPLLVPSLCVHTVHKRKVHDKKCVPFHIGANADCTFCGLSIWHPMYKVSWQIRHRGLYPSCKDILLMPISSIVCSLSRFSYCHPHLMGAEGKHRRKAISPSPGTEIFSLVSLRALLFSHLHVFDFLP